MPYELTLPPMGSSAEEGIVVAWFKREGATVRAGEPLLEVQFDKVSTEVEAPVDGRLHRILAPRDAVIKEGQTLALLLLPDETEEAAEPATPAAEATPAGEAPQAGATSTYPASPAARRLARELGVNLAQVTPANGRRITEEDVRRAAQQAQAPSPAAPAVEVRATPIAKRIAREHGIDLATIQGTGPGGRIVEQDVRAVLEQRATAPSEEGTGEAVGVERRPLSPMRRAIARRMMESLHNTAQLTMTAQADVTDLVQMREQWKATSDATYGGVTYTDLLVRAVALALVQHPHIRVRWADDALEYLPGIHVGVAVALEDGLVVPVVRDADRLSLAALSAEIKRLTGLARSGRLSEAEMAGGVLTVTNLGMYGIDAFTPILNPPESAILGVGRIYEQLVRGETGILWRQMMTLSLTVDHRLIDGAPAAAFLQRVCQLLGDPDSLVGPS
ncbi:2-oxo acid dehydrogenase subunit E2 [Litorilinea aerophila]|uniref:Dihydrolipoamide acetyltransferase component of pyruvate dehydrogenase complex n=1 Tax=Litorilinea aerophila TaxID=1204385 RepID=A0A540VB92_9CHLR|nr:dihydrolipoamide acetyltransferase family protein [Litorilinea aerophila]MCC9078159.1 2-oxo acid dehydrogenase subunit E2 [Litorilinea aerophila]